MTLLGTDMPTPLLRQFGMSTLVEAGGKRFVFDCGRGATQRLFQIEVPLADVDALFLTHLHSDHVVGIPDLWLTGWLYGRHAPFRVWGPDGTQDLMAHLEKAYEFDIQIRSVDEGLPKGGVSVKATDISEGVVHEEDGVKITAFFVDHGPVSPALGYRIDHDSRSVVLSGDTRLSENLILFSMGADLLIHSVFPLESFRDSHRGQFSPGLIENIIAHHIIPEQAGEVFSRVRPKLAVYSHTYNDAESIEELVTSTRRTYSGPLEVGEDLMTIDVGDEVVAHRPASDGGV